ncbi:MAG: DinB family protein [Bryobacteraceae bacterium]
MKILLCMTLLSVSAFAQSAPSLKAGSMGTYTMAKNNVLKAAAKMPEENFAFKPSDDVRSFGQIVGHLADAQYLFCSAVKGEKAPKGDVEKTATTKAALNTELKAAFDYCDAVYASATDDSLMKPIKFFGRDSTGIATLDFNTAHTFEHYGNIVTYMRIKGIVPPSSEPRPAPKKAN